MDAGEACSDMLSFLGYPGAHIWHSLMTREDSVIWHSLMTRENSVSPGRGGLGAGSGVQVCAGARRWRTGWPGICRKVKSSSRTTGRKCSSCVTGFTGCGGPCGCRACRHAPGGTPPKCVRNTGPLQACTSVMFLNSPLLFCRISVQGFAGAHCCLRRVHKPICRLLRSDCGM